MPKLWNNVLERSVALRLHHKAFTVWQIVVLYMYFICVRAIENYLSWAVNPKIMTSLLLYSCTFIH